jgi:hypothetical protein
VRVVFVHLPFASLCIAPLANRRRSAAWIGFFGGYDKISPEAWEQWDRLYAASRQLQKLEGREARLP